MLRDLNDLCLLASESRISAAIPDQAAVALRDEELKSAVDPMDDLQWRGPFARCRPVAPLR